MADPEKKDPEGLPSHAAGGGNGQGAAETSRASDENERLNAILLAIIEREVGRGEPRRAEEWSTLRQMALTHPSGPELVATFESVIDRCNRELVNRFGSQGIDLTRLRESVVMLIRVSLARKFALGRAAAKES